MKSSDFEFAEVLLAVFPPITQRAGSRAVGSISAAEREGVADG